MSNHDKEQLEKDLKQLRETPASTQDLNQQVLRRIFDYLVQDSLPANAIPHWFCSRADSLTREAATFLLRLHAYSSPQVAKWRSQLQSCLAGCSECVQRLQEVKVSSKDTYFGAFADTILARFYESFTQWELEAVLSYAGVDKSSPSPTKTFAQLPPSIALFMLSDPRRLKDQRILSVIHGGVPSQPIREWPHSSVAPPPALFFLLVDPNPEVRLWASRQIALHTTTPMSAEHFLPAHIEVFQTILDSISSYEPNSPYKWGDHFVFTQDLSALWSALCTTIRYLPPDWLLGSSPLSMDVRKLVLSHLSDNNAHFKEVFKAFAVILSSKRLGPMIWSDESDEYPQVIFNTIKDNQAFAKTLETIQPDEKHWSVGWLEVFVKTLAKHHVLSTLFPLVIQYLCEELQHERYGAVRASAVCVAVKLLGSELPNPHSDSELGAEGPSTALPMVLDSIKIHAKVFASVGFAGTYEGPPWHEGRKRAREFVLSCLKLDVDSLCRAISSVAKPRPKPGIHIYFPNSLEQVWRWVYEFILPTDSEAIAYIIEAVAAIAHVDDLHKVAFVTQFRHMDKEIRDEVAKLVTMVNNWLGVIRSGFSDALSRFLDFTDDASAKALLLRPKVTRATMVLMFSPIETFRQPAQSLIGLALNVESRPDCFRALLDENPDNAFKGMKFVLESFSRYSQTAPEACNLSKILALCLTDVIDALCSTRDGLLHRASFLHKFQETLLHDQLLEWWGDMCKALCNIFLFTRNWAPFFENEVMTMWMRDALIFGRDMLAQMKVIETIAAASQKASSALGEKLDVGTKMVTELRNVLHELVSWLKLTDPELLFQSFAFFQSLLALFSEERIRPRRLTMEKLAKYVDDARHPKGDRIMSRLDSSRVDDLEAALLPFQADKDRKADKKVEDDEDDEIEIISHNIKAPPERKKKIRRSSSIEIIGVTKRPPTEKAAEQPKRGYIIKQSRPDNVRKLSGKSKISNYFTGADDQRKLAEASSVVPKFSRPSTSAQVTRPPAPPRRERTTTATSSDYSSAKSSAAEDSPSSESSSDDEKDSGLASLAKKQVTPKIKKPTQPRGIKLMDFPGTAKNPALERLNRDRAEREEHRRTGLRLKPDVSFLHYTILSWDYNHTGDEPPGPALTYRKVPDQFTDAQQYRQVFEPLLLMECWAQIQQSKEATEDQYECRIVARGYNGQWIDMEYNLQGSVSEKWGLTDSDVVLLTGPGVDGKKCQLAKVVKYQTGFTGIQGTLRILASPNDSGPQVRSSWFLKKVVSLTTLHREYAALLGMPYYDLCGIILKPKLEKWPPITTQSVEQAQKEFNLNHPQARAVLSSLQTNGFSLIQGPPGTGKTSTICGLVQAFLKRRAKPTTSIHVGQTSGVADREAPKKILLCAPSNAAIDEITSRLKEGVAGPGKQLITPKVVRIGTAKNMNASVKDVALDSLVDQKLNSNPALGGNINDVGGEMAALRAKLTKVKQTREAKLQEMLSIHDNSNLTLTLEDEVKRLNKERTTLTSQLDKLRDQQKSNSRTRDATYRRFRAEVLQESDVICSTLAGAGHELLESFDFEMVIIDEAAQAIELSSLIPLKYRTNRCVMVGDPKQLPPTVISQQAMKFGYNQSLFVRLSKHQPDVVHLLSIQYRMHPEISVLPSKLFYSSRLLDGDDMAVKTRKPWHTHTKFGPYKFYNVAKGVEQQDKLHSYYNRTEADVAIALYNRLRVEFSSFDFEFKIGIVTMYRAQVLNLRRAFEARFGQELAGTVDFNTVDGFQGQEKDIIILSCVRAGPGVQSVGFLADVRRMNVALTRAKSSVFILGNAATLERSDSNWATIVNDARSRSCLVDVDVAFFKSAGPNGASRVPAAPRARISKSLAPASNTTPLPELSTPRELAASQQRRVSGTTLAAPPPPVSPTVTVPMDIDAPPPEEPVQLPQSSKLHEDGSDDIPGLNGGPDPAIPRMPPPAQMPIPARDPRPRPPKPPPKPRQKASASIFIPSKKPPKRPAPDGDAGPSTNRPRI